MIFRRVFLTGNGGFFVGLVLSLCENIHWDVGDTESGVCDTPPYRVHLINQYGKAPCHSHALGIGAASFASEVYGASKDIAESPTASPERHNNEQLTMNNG